ncbi:MAG: LPP20 family lipoprotein [Nitrospira sp.]|nr:LPP20 family lipoprotein [Nitrospira sp.]
MTLFVQRGRGAGLAILFVFCAGCGWMGGPARPAWIDGGSAQYPASQFLVGVGQAESRPQATEQAYAAVSRIFKAEITAQAKDWESYLVVESRGQTSTERRLTLDNVTRVTTDKVLENVQILDTWFDQKARQYYALAGMNRAQAESAMVERLAELDRTIQTQVAEARHTQDKLSRVRNLKRAAKNLVLREAYNTDLRTIRSSGQGNPAAYRVAELAAELEQFLSTQYGMAVEVSGEQAEPLERALIEGLTQEGFAVAGGAPSPVPCRWSCRSREPCGCGRLTSTIPTSGMSAGARMP